MVSIGYLALTRMPENVAALQRGRRRLRAVVPLLPVGGLAREAARRSSTRSSCRCSTNGRRRPQAGAGRALGRRERLRLCFGVGGSPWDEEKVLDRYELLYEAGLVEEARRDGREAALARAAVPALGEPMRFDHRRILATAIARLRAKLKYRPVVFELMAREFTLTELQRTVEAISGPAPAQAEFPPPGRDAPRWSSRPARPRPRPAGGRRRCSASAARCCRSALRPACASARARHDAFARRALLR